MDEQFSIDQKDSDDLFIDLMRDTHNFDCINHNIDQAGVVIFALFSYISLIILANPIYIFGWLAVSLYYGVK